MELLATFGRYLQPKATITRSASVALGVLSAVMVPQGQPRAVAALSAASAAVSSGSGSRLQSLRISGTVTLTNLDGSKMSCPVELRIVIPSSYFRIERQRNLTRQSGFSGATLLNDLKPDNPSAQIVQDYPSDQIDIERARLRRLLLGMAAIVTADSTPMSLESTVLDGHPVDLVHLNDVRIKELRLALAKSDHLPLVVVVRHSVVVPARAGENVSLQPAARAQILDLQQWFEDRRLVGGHRLPFLIRTVAGGVELDRLAVGTIEVNPAFGARDFER